MPDQQTSINPNLFSADKATFFKSFIGRQDEVPANFQGPEHATEGTMYVQKDVHPLIQVHISDSNLYCTSVFVPHELTPRKGTQPVLQTGAPDWMIGIFSLCLLLLIIARVFFQRRFSQIFNAFLRPRHLSLLIREGNILRERITPPMLLLHMLSFSLFFYLLIDQAIPTKTNFLSGFLLFLLIFGAYALFYGLRSLFIYLIGWTFNTHESTNSYLVNSSVMDEMLGVFMLPISLVLLTGNRPEGKTVLMIGLVLFTVVLLYRIIRNFLVGLSNVKFSSLYLFLYLCTIEILPVLAFGKLINDWLLA